MFVLKFSQYAIFATLQGNNEDCVTIPYTISSNIPSSEPITGVVFFDGGVAQLEKEVKIDLDLVPTDLAEEIYTIAFDQPRGGLETELEDRKFQICVSHDVQIPIIEFGRSDGEVKQSEKSLKVDLFRKANCHGSVMVKYAVSSLSLGKEQRWEKFEDGTGKLELNVDLPQYPVQLEREKYILEILELEGASLPRLGDVTKCSIAVENDLKPTVGCTVFSLFLQTDFQTSF